MAAISTVGDWLPEETIIPEIPNDVALLCLSRASTQCHPILAAVSKPIRSIVLSPEFLAFRSVLDLSEEVLYFLSQSDVDNVPEIFALYRNPTARVARVPPLPERLLTSAASVSVGHRIYIIGGCTGLHGRTPTAAVWVLDCRTHTWSRGPNMIRPRSRTVFASAIDGKIYAVGGGTKETPGPFAEFLDTAVQKPAWEAVPAPPGDVASSKEVTQSLAIGGTVHVWFLNWEELRLDAAALTWEAVPHSYPRWSEFVYGDMTVAADSNMENTIRGLWEDAKLEWMVVNAGGRPVVLASKGEKMCLFDNGIRVDVSKKKKFKSLVKVVEDDGRWRRRDFWSEDLDSMYKVQWTDFQCNCFSVHL